MAGVSPFPYTMRELVWMAEAKEILEWDQTSLMWALTANSMRDPKKQRKPFSPADVHPLRDAKAYEAEPVQADISILKMLLPKGNNGK